MYDQYVSDEILAWYFFGARLVIEKDYIRQGFRHENYEYYGLLADAKELTSVSRYCQKRRSPHPK